MTDTRRIERIGYYGVFALISWVVALIVQPFQEDTDIMFLEIFTGLFQEPVIAIVMWIIIGIVLEAFIFN